MLNNEQITEIKSRLEAATPGPWIWDVNSAYHQMRLLTTHSGMYFVMGFRRWGTQSAAPAFQVFTKYEGPVSERGSRGLQRADKLLKSHPGKEHHEGYDDDIDHPDAQLIAHAPEDIRVLLDEIERLRAENEALKRAVGRA